MYRLFLMGEPDPYRWPMVCPAEFHWEKAGGMGRMGGEELGTNTASLLQGSPFHSRSYPRLTAKPQDQHITPKVATGGSVCSEWHLLLGKSNVDHRVGWALPVIQSSINLATETAPGMDT